MRGLRVAWAAAIGFVAVWIVAFGIVALTTSPARAVDAVNVRVDLAAINLTDEVEQLKSEGGRVQVSTAPGSDGIVRRIEVLAREAGTDWAVIALANSSDEERRDRVCEPIEITLVVAHVAGGVTAKRTSSRGSR